MSNGKKANIRQVLLFSVINYAGTAIGIISVLFIYPLNNTFSGTIRLVDNIAQLLFPLMVLGASHALIKFYPGLSAERRLQLFNYSIVSIIYISLAVLFGLVLFVNFAEYDNAGLLYYGFPIAVCLAFIELFKKQSQDLQRIAVPTLYEKIIPKIVLPAVFLLMAYGMLQATASLFVYTACYILILALTALYLFRHFKPGMNYRFRTLFGELSRRDYYRYSLYAFAGSLGSMLAFRIDGLIIPEFFSLADNGVFGYAVTLSSTLQIPAIGMFALYAPLVSGYLKSENFTELSHKYKDVARLLLFIGALFYCCIVLGVEDLFMMLPTYEKLKGAIPVIYVLGLSVVVNMATGFNGEIITYSKYYRFNLITVALLIAFNISFSLYGIHYTNLGITGVAWASFLSMALFNVAKLAFIYRKFGIHPFDNAYLKLVVIFGISLPGIYLLPDTDSHFVNLIYKCGLSLMLNVIVVYRLKLVPQVNEWMDKLLAKVIR
ncbi:MAG: lipopolysaccharide biosynthesis protein [Flavobacterium sp.]